MDNRSFGWCFIGSGSITKRVMKDMHLTDGGYLAAVYSRSFEHASELAAMYGATAYASIEEALTNPAVKAVYVATPHTLHREHTLTALRRGLPVLCEKPIAMNGQDTREMLAAAKQGDTYLMDGIWTRHNPAIRQALKWVHEGRIGRVRSLTAAFSFNSIYDPTSRLFDPEQGGGALLDVGVYVISFARFVMNRQPVRLSATADFAPNGVDNLCAITFGYEDGAVARLFCGLSVNEPQDAAIYGEEGSIHIPHFWAPKSAHLTTAQGQEDFVPGFEGEGFQFEFNAAMQDIGAGRKENTLLTHEVTEQIMASINNVNLLIKGRG